MFPFSPRSSRQAGSYPKHTVTCIINYRRGFGLRDLIYCTLYTHNSGLQAIQRYRYSTRFAVRRYTRTRILSLH
jgi:hypothetical protein